MYITYKSLGTCNGGRGSPKADTKLVNKHNLFYQITKQACIYITYITAQQMDI